MSVTEYFSRRDTPSEHSPVGEMMLQVLAAQPSLSLDRARQIAREILHRRGAYKIWHPDKKPTILELGCLSEWPVLPSGTPVSAIGDPPLTANQPGQPIPPDELISEHPASKRVGRPRKWNSDRERMATTRAQKRAA